MCSFSASQPPYLKHRKLSMFQRRQTGKVNEAERMTPELFTVVAMHPALLLLPRAMDSPAAEAMIISICLQESGLVNRTQVGGPARGFAQFERSGVVSVLEHPKSGPPLKDACKSMTVPPDAGYLYAAIGYNDVLACVLARALLWTLPQPLPLQGDNDGSWAQYVEAWRPGKPHRLTWNTIYARAWGVITSGGT